MIEGYNWYTSSFNVLSHDGWFMITYFFINFTQSFKYNSIVSVGSLFS